MQKLVAGVDFNSRVAKGKTPRTWIDVVFVRGNELPHWTRFSCSYTDHVKAAHAVAAGVAPILSQIDVLAIERPWSANRGVTATLMRMQGVIIGQAKPEVEVLEVHPQKWKAATVGRSNATKEEVTAWVYTTQPEASAYEWDENACDAYCIALWGQQEV